jgi:hypothetical protein
MTQITIVDIETLIDEPEQISLCCLCGNVVGSDEEALIGVAHGVKCLVHFWCVDKCE